MTPRLQDLSAGDENPVNAAAKPTALPTVVVGVRQLVLAVTDYVLATTDTSHEPGLRAHVLAFRSMVLADHSDNKWAKAVRKDRQIELDMDGQS